MQKILKTLFLTLFSIASLSTNLFSQTLQHNPQKSTNDKTKTIESRFRDYGIDGTFVIKLGSKTYIINQKRAATTYPPASTFKIYNSLFALDSGLVKNVDTIFYRYNGENVSFEVWKNDANLKNAMKFSQVPAFQQIARELGREKMQNYLNILNFGNKKIGKLDYFWLDDSLKISALEQLELMDKPFCIAF
ncbi:class D beta-lactamase [Helicobacter sp. MIT 11-5569]|uniref:penicillin-binding transpeptidase domain-containing protein n=1 Tax=Helicobacter sp. MIT 11-5569 TaxID=1548151 RepID=UPI000691F264|nr:penicillin-binding transpeptidase domain-containing protein [Helicobacter sp. MIT 11-5569]TLD84004.1 class D beta-lactamase [Helicobacter sp. MIT 11-5569]